MTTTTSPTLPLTARSLLLDEPHDDDRLRDTLEQSGALRAVETALAGLSAGLIAVACDRVAGLVDRFLELDLAHVLLAGWRRYSALTDAARKSLAVPGAEEIVDLAEHRVTSAHRPRIDVAIDGVSVATIGFALDLSLDLHAVRAVVARGRLVSLRSGRADLDGRLACEGVPVVQATRQVELPGMVSLGSGVPLIDTSETLSVSPGEGYVTLP